MSVIDVKKKDPNIKKVQEKQEQKIEQPSYKKKRLFSKIRTAIKKK